MGEFHGYELEVYWRLLFCLEEMQRRGEIPIKERVRLSDLVEKGRRSLMAEQICFVETTLNYGGSFPGSMREKGKEWARLRHREARKVFGRLSGIES